MQKNKKIGLIVGGILILVVVFYGGMVYGGNNVRASITSRGTNFGQNGMMGGNRDAKDGNFGGFTSGQIIAKDANSVTIQIMANQPGQNGTSTGGSKIIFLDTNTKVTKSVDGALSDLAIGTQVSITGTANTDGSVNAQTVQIRPNIVPPMVK